MDQLLKVTTISFQAIRFTQNARLLPADNMTLERHKALARHNALKQRYQSGSSAMDFDYINQVQAAFSAPSSSDSSAVSVRLKQKPAADLSSGSQAGSVSGAPSVPKPAAPVQSAVLPAGSRQAVVSDQGSSEAAASASSEVSSFYNVQRGSFELRVAKGELSYVPPLVMTIVTQYPEVEFEYVGGFNYFPPDEESSEMNITI